MYKLTLSGLLLIFWHASAIISFAEEDTSQTLNSQGIRNQSFEQRLVYYILSRSTGRSFPDLDAASQGSQFRISPPKNVETSAIRSITPAPSANSSESRFLFV